MQSMTRYYDLRAITSVDIKLCKMENGAHFTRYEQKNLSHQPVQICTDTVACAYNLLIVFSLSSVLSLTSLSLSHFIIDAHTLSFFHLISLACSSFRRLPRSKPSPSPTRSSRPSHRTSPSTMLIRFVGVRILRF